MNAETLPNWVRQRAHLTPARTAIVAESGAWTFAELSQEVDRIARWLGAVGIGKGDHIALLMRNSIEFVLLVHAAAAIEAILVPLNTRLTVKELTWQTRDCGARLLIHDEFHADAAVAVASGLPSVKSCMVPDAGRKHAVDQMRGPASALEQTRLDAVHSIMYTSGTTGRPKGAQLTYGNHWWSAIGAALNLGLIPEDRWLVCLPLFHIGGMSILLRGVIYGITAIVQPGFDPSAVNRAIDEKGVTIVSLVATMLSRVLDARGDRPFPSTLRCVLLGGGPAPEPLLRACADRGVPVVQTYGLTESASQVATLAPEDAMVKLGSAGKPLFPTEIRVVDRDIDCPAGAIGEILVRGPTVTPGYLNRPDATASAIQAGWLRTGDLGYLDGDGYLYVVDRRDDLIVSGGENIYPAEVESILMAHPAVAEAAVFGVPDPLWGQSVQAAITLRKGDALSADDLIAFARSRMAGYKVPRDIRIMQILPRNAAGKLLRRLLRPI